MSGNEAGLIPARFSAYLVPGSLVTQAFKHTNTTGWIMREHPNPTAANSYAAGKAVLSVPSRGSQSDTWKKPVMSWSTSYLRVP